VILPHYFRDPVTSDYMLVCSAFSGKFDPEQVLMKYILSRVALVIMSKLNIDWLIKKILAAAQVCNAKAGGQYFSNSLER
jgi:hypothetical protein